VNSSLSYFAFFQVEVIFVDFGNKEVVNTSELILLETLKKSVAQFPHQVSSYVTFPEYNGCFTWGGTWHFINNSDTNKDIATKFGVDLPQFMRSLVLA
jgi:hypothetical protein